MFSTNKLLKDYFVVTYLCPKSQLRDDAKEKYVHQLMFICFVFLNNFIDYYLFHTVFKPKICNVDL